MDHVFISSAEIREPTQQYPVSVNGMDRTVGKGRGHMFGMTRDSQLIKDIALSQGDICHLGGIDFHEKNAWVPQAEYRGSMA